MERESNKKFHVKLARDAHSLYFTRLKDVRQLGTRLRRKKLIPYWPLKKFSNIVFLQRTLRTKVKVSTHDLMIQVGFLSATEFIFNRVCSKTIDSFLAYYLHQTGFAVLHFFLSICVNLRHAFIQPPSKFTYCN